MSSSPNEADGLSNSVEQAERLKRDVQGIKESVRLSWFELFKQLDSPEERLAIRKGIDALVEELQILGSQIDHIEDGASGYPLRGT
jgi:hypothetical protein